ncbi:hypothetical protein EDF78_11738 [Rahnella sp. BIGb0236]|jgi:hypothetical protein|uniref:hypothetical protein n=1 Tax=Rahnella sp. BIGb0236 TaxID=2485117 RepID=UPI00105BF9F5|nr:hypothetical protein [Rahnella sp. BIGb0236]TDS85912.1 hypothetical protein EDF78_11738 [Rahnella sp. BIGb0236]
MKNKKIEFVVFTKEQRWSAIAVSPIFIWICYLLPSIFKEQIIDNLSYPDIVSVDTLAFMVMGGAPVCFICALGVPYAGLRGVISIKKGRKILIPACYLSLACMFLAIIYPIGFISTLEQKGYGHCWKDTMRGPTLYVKDANECVKRNLPIMVRPRDQPEENTPATVYEDPFRKWREKAQK